MSQQQQPQKPQPQQQHGDDRTPQRQQQQQQQHKDPIKYGDVFNVSGDVASEPIMPRDAALMQATENQALGQTQKGGPAAVMQSAAAVNASAGLAGCDYISGVARDQGVSVSEAKVGANRVITESVGTQVGKDINLS